MSNIILPVTRDNKGAIVVASAALSAAVISYESPVFAQAAASTGGVSDVSTMVTSLGGIAAAVTTVVLGAMGVRMAIKLVNRVGVKG